MAIRTEDPLVLPEVDPSEVDHEERGARPIPERPESIAHADLKDRAFVYEWPVRLWHWVMSLALVVLGVTGWLVAYPLESAGGEAFDLHRMSWIRSIHFIAGYAFAITMIGRIYWAVVGNDHARQIFYLPVWKKTFWRQLYKEMRWYAFLERRPDKHVGHNPLARVSMNLMFLGGALLVTLTGFALYGEELGTSSWAYAAFGWITDLFGGIQQTRSWHHISMWILVVFTMAHVYAVIREDIMGRQSTVSTMISGWRFFRDGSKDVEEDP